MCCSPVRTARDHNIIRETRKERNEGEKKKRQTDALIDECLEQQPVLVHKLAPHLVVGGLVGVLLERACVKFLECVHPREHRPATEQRVEKFAPLALAAVPEAGGGRAEVLRLDLAGLPLELPGGRREAVLGLRLEGVALLAGAQARGEALAGRVRGAAVEPVETKAVSTRSGKEPRRFGGKLARERIERVEGVRVRHGRLHVRWRRRRGLVGRDCLERGLDPTRLRRRHLWRVSVGRSERDFRRDGRHRRERGRLGHLLARPRDPLLRNVRRHSSAVAMAGRSVRLLAVGWQL